MYRISDCRTYSHRKTDPVTGSITTALLYSYSHTDYVMIAHAAINMQLASLATLMISAMSDLAISGWRYIV